MSSVLDVTDATFSVEVLEAEGPVLVDFWAEWCAPCRQLSPILEDMAEAHRGRLTLVKVDVDANREIAAQYGIISIPAVYLFLNGEIVGRTSGAKSRRELEAEFSEHLGQ